MPLPAQCLPFIGTRVKERKREREKIGERRGRRMRRERKIRDPFVLGDMRMSEKEGTIVVEWKDRGVGGLCGGRAGLVGGLWGTKGGGRRVWACGMSGGGGGGVKDQSVGVLWQSTVGPP